ncbi:sensor histidine kinase [Streptomyces sp. NPDC001339]|uniref:sensor histidine kinase n=1 Tax=Streptomyces sp. NPDC001339 TaxID=3364563 RepID=UPI0036A9BE9E
MVRKRALPRLPSTAVYAWLIPVVASAVVVGLVSPSGPAAAVWIGGTAVVAVVVTARVAARGSRRAVASQEAAAAQTSTVARQQDATARLADKLVPDMLTRLRLDSAPEEVLNWLTARWADSYRGLPPEFQAAHWSVLRTVIDAVDAEEALRDSAQRSLVNLSRRVQAIVHQQAQELREMEDRHGQFPAVFGDLLRIDHNTALIGRLADSIAVLGGARPGRQWNRPVPLYSVLRGAMSRIVGYERVDLSAAMDVAVVGPGVEPLIHAVAELLDNATRYSPPHTRVHLTAAEVQSGIAVEIEDGGVGMSEPARRRAERMLEQAQHGIDLGDLGESPRLGLAVVGRLAQAYGFQVSLRKSAYGGVRAVLVVPQQLITTAAEASGVAHGIGTFSGPRVAAESRPVIPRQASAPQAAPYDADDRPVGRTANGLPQRRRRIRAANADDAPVGRPRHGEPGAQRTPGEWLVAFKDGLTGGGNGEGDDAAASRGEQ